MHAALSDAALGQPPGLRSFSVAGFTALPIGFAGNGSGDGTIRLANTGDPPTAYTYGPSADDAGGDVFFGPSGAAPVAGNYDSTSSSTSSAMRSASSTATRAAASARCRRHPTRWNTR